MEVLLVGWSGELGEKAVKVNLKNKQANCVDSIAAALQPPLDYHDKREFRKPGVGA